ncbi:hypothetical protein AOLI_G00215350 [Acnodon oligacanthus]
MAERVRCVLHRECVTCCCLTNERARLVCKSLEDAGLSHATGPSTTDDGIGNVHRKWYDQSGARLYYDWSWSEQRAAGRLTH